MRQRIFCLHWYIFGRLRLEFLDWLLLRYVTFRSRLHECTSLYLLQSKHRFCWKMLILPCYANEVSVRKLISVIFGHKSEDNYNNLFVGRDFSLNCSFCGNDICFTPCAERIQRKEFKCSLRNSSNRNYWPSIQNIQSTQCLWWFLFGFLSWERTISL